MPVYHPPDEGLLQTWSPNLQHRSVQLVIFAVRKAVLFVVIFVTLLYPCASLAFVFSTSLLRAFLSIDY